MKKLIFVLVAILFSLNFIANAQLAPNCRNDAVKRQQFGDYCIVIVPTGFVEGIDGYYPMDVYLEYFDPSTQETDIGRVVAYEWIVAEQRYHYRVINHPSYAGIEPPIIYPLVVVSPENVILASEELWGN